MSASVVFELAALLLGTFFIVTSGLLEASLRRRNRMTIRDMLDNGTGSGAADAGQETSADLRLTAYMTMLTGLLLVGAGTMHAGLRLFDSLWIALPLALALPAAVVAGRLLPAAIVESYSLAESTVIERLATAAGIVLFPIIAPYQAAASLLEGRAEQRRAHHETLAEHESSPPVDLDSVSSPGELDHDEHEMISGILGLEKAFAREIMTPRPDVVAVALDTSVSEVVRIAQEAGHSRIPVYDQTIDRIRGIIYAKDLLRFVSDDVHDADLAGLLRPAMFVPESKRIDDLLKELRRARVHLAIVVDEYGGTAGLVTIEDIIEEIVGEIQDEYDHEIPLYQFEGERTVIVDGRMPVDELSELLDVSLPDTESDTVGGLVQRELGHIPEPGESILSGPVTLRVESVERRRVKSVQVVMRDEEPSSDAIDRARAI